MAANFQPHMGGPGQMMPQQRPQPRVPQNGVSSQIQQAIYQTVSSQTGLLTGWQSNVLIQERIGLIFSILGNLRLASQNTQNPPGLNKMIEIGIKFEKEIFQASPDQASYKAQVDAKLRQLLERRNQNQAGLQQTIQQQAQAQAQAQQQQAQQQQMMMNQNGMQGQPPRTMPQQPAQQGFQHLQHQMQASPLPGQQPQMPMGMTNDSLPPNMTPQQQQQFQMSMQQSQQPQPQQSAPPMTQQDNAILMELANRLMNQAPSEEKNQIRATLTKRMDPQQLNLYAQRGQDPLIVYYRNQALNKLRAEKTQRMQAQHMAGQNAAPPMQQQRSMNPSPLAGQPQPPTSMGGNPDFGGYLRDLGNLGNADSIANQQQQGVIAQGQGEVVVPANNPRNPTPQPGPGQPMPNPNRSSQQQHMMNVHLQQQQQQRMHAVQQQTQARLNAQSKAQMGLQGQPGGMGNGPMPPQQSPAMPTLNTPLRTPSQMGHAEAPHPQPNPPFGQPLDPRFANQRPAGPGNAMNTAGLNPAMFAGMTQQQQQEIVSLPPDKLNEVMNKWNEQRQINAANMQAGRPPIPMQGNQSRPGQQVPQQGPFNPQNPNQFAMNGQRPQGPQMTAAMTPQQQSLLQAQIARLQNPPQRNGQTMGLPNEQRMMAQMDGLDFPATLLNHQNMPRGIPPDIKKWGPLKGWAQQNPNMGAEVFETLKSLQRMHWQQLMRARAAGAMQPGAPGPQGPMPAIPAGMSAPVAPMGQPPVQLPNGVSMPGSSQMRQATQQEIENVRNHPSGRMLQADDNTIRMFLMRQAAQRQQAQTQQIQNQLMQNQISQMNGPRPGQPQPNPIARGPNQASPAQVPTPKQVAQPAPPIAGAPTNRAARPNARNAAQNSSPAQPAKNLKRASSDDVVEVPNPNAAQNVRSAQQQAQNQSSQAQKQPQQQVPQPQNPAQLAALDPESRKKYEQALKGARDKADMDKLTSIRNEEQQNNQPAPEIPMDPATKADVVKRLKEILVPLNNMNRAVVRWYQITRDEPRTKAFFRLKNRVGQQFKDQGMTQPKDRFSMIPRDIEQGRGFLQGMVKDLSDRFPAMKKSDSAQAHPTGVSQPPAQTSQPVPTPPTVQLSHANLQQQQIQLNKMHQRSGSRGSHAPAAPTSSQPPFQFGAGSPPPDGVPAYATKPPLTRDELKLPAKKKQKQDNKAAMGQTPGSNASPHMTKPISPEVKRQPAETKQQPRSLFTCSDPDCDRHDVGFESEEALRIHTQEHTIENPMLYAQQNLASMLGLDPSGHAKKPVVSQEPLKMSVSGSKQGQTPNMKSENTPTATPMNRQVSMNRQGSTTGNRPGAASKATPRDMAKTPAGQSKQQPSQPPKEVVVEDPWANATIDPHDLFQAFQPFESGGGGAISDMNVYRSITPNDTPESSKDGLSEPNSDISDGVGLDISLDIFDEKWQPFGPSEIDGLFDMNMNNFNVNADDLKMFDTNLSADVEQQQPAMGFGSWEDMVDTAAFDRPFVFDASLYSMNAD
ncbi:hypothetical protein LOCC1_G005571 [Lachnellula occidentalis]|uniref:Mediator complex subunit 15 KIX domain-containing protein n=1 Tax=Lachnellula occidentalis TaxID=215460 RepID=A0A8H8U9C5_9HELO|nr:hypothetical protein LOCC1_G005571 [Lachnellula occidentalis]